MSKAKPKLSLLHGSKVLDPEALLAFSERVLGRPATEAERQYAMIADL